MDELEHGDKSFVDILGHKLAYEVDNKKVVTPRETSDLIIEEDKDYITLLTCHPYMINSHRLLSAVTACPKKNKRSSRKSRPFKKNTAGSNFSGSIKNISSGSPFLSSWRSSGPFWTKFARNENTK